MNGPAATRPGAILRAKLAVAALRISLGEGIDRTSLALGARLVDAGRRTLLLPHRAEAVSPPAPLVVGGVRLDVVGDLVEYTGLSRPVVEQLVRRRIESFRSEWYGSPPELRSDAWYYRATHAYLFGNAVHVHESPVVLDVLNGLASPGLALDFGGGTGNLAMGLCLSGWEVDHLERSAIQKDFVRFRADRHALGARLRVLDDWKPLEAGRYDLVCALDVLEHVPDLDAALHGLLPSVKVGGVLFESSPFERTVSNPMHHEHRTLEASLAPAGFALRDSTPCGRVWRREA